MLTATFRFIGNGTVVKLEFLLKTWVRLSKQQKVAPTCSIWNKCLNSLSCEQHSYDSHLDKVFFFFWKSLVQRGSVEEGCPFDVSRKKQVAIQQKAPLIKASIMVRLCKLVKYKPTCMCYVGQVVVLGAPRKLLQFTVWQVKSPARGSLLERLFHATAGRYCGRQLGSIPSSHQTYRSTSFYTLFEASTPLSYPVGPYNLQSGRSSSTLL